MNLWCQMCNSLSIAPVITVKREQGKHGKVLGISIVIKPNESEVDNDMLLVSEDLFH